MEAGLIRRLTITTPRDLYSPYMSPIFGFELVLNVPQNATEFNYVCGQGAFCAYKNAHKLIGNNATTVETVYWTRAENGECNDIVYAGDILISVTALNSEGKKVALETATVQCDPMAVGSIAGSRTEDNEVRTVNAEYEGKSGEPVIINYTLRCPVSGETGWAHGEPIPWVDPEKRLIIPPYPPENPLNLLLRLKNITANASHVGTADITFRPMGTDYSGESEIFRNRLEDETLTLEVEFSTDPRGYLLGGQLYWATT